MRGKQPIPDTDFPHKRNIPAYAGKTAVGLIAKYATTEHPRVCGENALRSERWKSQAGTSPRMRGKLLVPNSFGIVSRNIPAYAGKTLKKFSYRLKGPGTSPRMRGKLLGGEFQQLSGRNIPAYAGKTGNINTRVAVTDGTSPRMRGKPMTLFQQDVAKGNIPAYAGKTKTVEPAMHMLPEHPRVCGENLRVGRRLVLRLGTSPRMRGKLKDTLEFANINRNIPAYAGKTNCAVYSMRQP